MKAREPSGASPAATASVLVREYGVCRAVNMATATSRSLSTVAPSVSLLYAEVARIIERSFVEADMRQARCGQ